MFFILTFAVIFMAIVCMWPFKIRITKTPEAVYYHPLRSCVPHWHQGITLVYIEDGVLCKLVDANKQLLWREFGIRF